MTRNRMTIILAGALSALGACNENGGLQCHEGEAVCTGNVARTCARGYPGETSWYVEECDSDEYCVVSESGSDALCSLSLEQDPLCVVEGAPVCAGAVMLECYAGYRVSEWDCGEPELCREDLGFGTCLVRPDPDPLCRPESFDHLCDGDLNVSCLDGWRIEEQDCGPGLCYPLSDVYTACVLSTDPDPRCAGIDSPAAREGNFCEGDTHLWCDPESGLMATEECDPDSCHEDEAGINRCNDEDGV